MFTIWVTRACNMNCGYCYEGSKKQNNYMKEDTAEAVVNWMIKTAASMEKEFYHVRFHGGEPLLNMEIIKYIIDRLDNQKAFRFIYEITTNAYCLREEDAEYLAGHMSSVSVSLDGNKKTNDRNRLNFLGESTFENVLHNAGILKEKFEYLLIRMTVGAKTGKYLAENVHFLLQEGFVYIDAEVDVFDSEWTVEEVNKLENECRILRQELGGTGLLDSVGLPIGYKVLNKPACSGGAESLHVDTDGRVYPCIMAVGEADMYIGNVFTGILEERQKQIKQISEKELSVCAGCGGYDSCDNVRCRIINRAVMGDCGSPIPLVCELHRRNLKYQSYSDNISTQNK